MKSMLETMPMDSGKKMDVKDMEIERITIRRLDDGTWVMECSYCGEDKKGNTQYEREETSYKNINQLISKLREFDKKEGGEPKSKYLMSKEKIGE